MLKQWNIALVTVLLTAFGLNAATELVLVKDGISHAPIVVYADAPPMTRQAADELAEYIERISGARPEVIVGRPDPLPKHAIWVGVQPALKELFPNLDLEFKHPEEILLAANDDHLLIAGRDRWDPDHLTIQTRYGELVGKQQEYGTVNAVYTFLQDHLDVRWLWPGELGLDLVRRDTIAMPAFTYRYHPQLRSRAGVFTYSRQGDGVGYGRSGKWCRLQRLQLDSLDVHPGGHGFGTWWNQFHSSHPEYFALQPDGTRAGGDTPFPSAGTVKMCLSNPGLWEQWMQTNVADLLQDDPLRVVFDASENDSWASGYCICENCRRWDCPDAELRIFRWKGIGQQYVAMSDRQVTFANHLADKLKQRYPDKDYYVKIFAYGHSRPAPVEAVPDDNVIVVSVANFFTTPNKADRGSPNGILHRDQFAAWGKVAPNLFWRPNQARRMGSMPNVPTRQTIKDFRFAAENHCIGIYIDMIWENWATRGPMYYAMAQMAWNPWQDGDALLKDYYQRGFGKAAEAMTAYWDLMEEKAVQSWEKTYDHPDLFDDAFFKSAYALLDRADGAVADQPEKYRERIAFMRIGLDYTRLVTEARKAMIRFEQSSGTDKAAEDEARDIWVNRIKPLATSETYPYALNWGPMRPGNGFNHNRDGRYPADLQKNLL